MTVLADALLDNVSLYAAFATCFAFIGTIVFFVVEKLLHFEKQYWTKTIITGIGSIILVGILLLVTPLPRPSYVTGLVGNGSLAGGWYGPATASGSTLSSVQVNEIYINLTQQGSQL